VTDQYFKKFKTQSTNIASIAPALVTVDLWAKQFGLDIMIVSDEIWYNEPLLRTITQKFPIEIGSIIRIPPNTVYNWHVDGTRAAGINLKLSGDGISHSLFGETVDEWNDTFTELKYDYKSFYLFNTQHKHSVINFDSYRYMFSVQFAQTKDQITYQEIYDWCKNEGLFDE
jgi:hypothetical protein